MILEDESIDYNYQNEIPEEKYYDTYTYNISDITFNRRILGDAIGEMGPYAKETYRLRTEYISSWYKNVTTFVRNEYPWFAELVIVLMDMGLVYLLTFMDMVMQILVRVTVLVWF